MKISRKINNRVNESVAECRKTFTDVTIELLKMLGTKPTQPVMFREMLILYQHKGNKTLTLIADRIYYCETEGGDPFYMISTDNDNFTTSTFLSLSNMQIIYNLVRWLVLAE